MNCCPLNQIARHIVTCTSVELFHLWALVTALPAGIIILLVLLRKQLQKLFTICCRRNPECCCTPCCVRHQCCGLAAEKRKKQASEKKRKLSTNEKAESQQRLLDPVSDDAESRMHASVAAEKASAGKCDSVRDQKLL